MALSYMTNPYWPVTIDDGKVVCAVINCTQPYLFENDSQSENLSVVLISAEFINDLIVKHRRTVHKF